MPTYLKDSDAILDYKFDWKTESNGRGFTDYLESNETISTITVTADTGITIDSSSITDTSTTATIWLSGGVVGTSYTVSCKITTSLSRTDERSITISVVQR